MSSADLSKSKVDLLVQQVNALSTDSNTSIISMEEDIPIQRKGLGHLKIRDYTPP